MNAFGVWFNCQRYIYTSQIFHFSCDAVDDELFRIGKVGLFDRLPMRDCVVLIEFLDKLAKAWFVDN